MPLLPEDTTFTKPKRELDPLVAARKKAADLRAKTFESFQRTLPLEQEVAEKSRFADRGTVFPARSAAVGAFRSLQSGFAGVGAATADLFGLEGVADSLENFSAEAQGELQALDAQAQIERQRQSGGNQLGEVIGETFTATARSSLSQAAGAKLGSFAGSPFQGLLLTASTEQAGNTFIQTRLAGGTKAEARNDAAIAFSSEYLITATFQKVGLGGLEASAKTPLRQALKTSLQNALAKNEPLRQVFLKAGMDAVKRGSVQTIAEFAEEIAIPIMDDSLSSLLVGVTREEFGSPEFLADLQKKTDAAIRQTAAQMLIAQNVRGSQAVTDVIGVEAEARADFARSKKAEEQRVADEAQAAQDAEARGDQAFAESVITPDTEIDQAIQEDGDLAPFDLSGEGAKVRTESEAEQVRQEVETRVKGQLQTIRAVDVLPPDVSQKQVNDQMAEVEKQVQALIPDGKVTREGNALILTDAGGSRTAFMLLSPQQAAESAVGKGPGALKTRENAWASLQKSGTNLVDENGQAVTKAAFLKMSRPKAVALLAANSAVKGWMLNNPRGGNFPVDADTLIALTDPNAILEEYHHKLVANQLTNNELKAAAQHLSNIGKLDNPNRSADELLSDSDSAQFMENLAQDYMDWRNERLNPAAEVKVKRPGIVRRFFERIFKMFTRAQKPVTEVPVHPLQQLNEDILSGRVGARQAQRRFAPQEPSPFSDQARSQQTAENKRVRERLQQESLQARETKAEQAREDAPRLRKLKEQRLAAQEVTAEQKAESQVLKGQRLALQAEKQALAELTQETRETEAVAREQRALNAREKALDKRQADLDKQAERALQEDVRLEKLITQEEATRSREAERELKQEARLEDTEGKRIADEQKRVDRANLEDQRRLQRQKKLGQTEQSLAQGQRRLNVAETRVALSEAKVIEDARKFLTSQESDLNPEQRQTSLEIIELENEIDLLQDLVDETDITPEQRAEVEADIDQMNQRIQSLAQGVPESQIEGPGPLFSLRANQASTPEGRRAAREVQDQAVQTVENIEQQDAASEALLQEESHSSLIRKWTRIINDKGTLGTINQGALRMLIERSNAVMNDPAARNKAAAELRQAKLLALDYQQGSEAGRQLGARRDRILTPEQRRAELERIMVEPPTNLITRIRALQKQGAFKRASQLLLNWNQNEVQRVIAKLDAAGIDLGRLPNDELTQERFFQLKADIEAKRSKITPLTFVNLANTIAYNALLSPISAGKALIGNTAFATVMGIEVGAEVAINEMVRFLRGGKGIKGAATFASAQAGIKAAFKGMYAAPANALYALATGRSRALENIGFSLSQFEQQEGEGIRDPIDELFKTAPQRAVGRILLAPNTTLLITVDELMNSVVAQAMISSAAVKQGVDNGLTDQALSDFVTQAAANPQQTLNEASLKEIKDTTDVIALRSGFDPKQSEFNVDKISNGFKKFFRAGETARNVNIGGVRPGQLIVAFYRTIVNGILQTSKYAPITSTIALAVESFDAAVRLKGDPVLAAEANLRALQQSIRVIGGMAVIGMLELFFEDEDEESVIQGTKGKQFSSEQRLANQLGSENTVFGRDISQVDPLGAAFIDYANLRDAINERNGRTYLNANFETFIDRPFGQNISRFFDQDKEEFFGRELSRRANVLGGFQRAFEQFQGTEVRSRKDDAPIVGLFGDTIKKREAGALSRFTSVFGVKDIDDLKGEKRAWAKKLIELQDVAKELTTSGVIPGSIRDAPKGVKDLTAYRQNFGKRFFELLQRIGNPGEIKADAPTLKRIQRANREARKWAARRS